MGKSTFEDELSAARHLRADVPSRLCDEVAVAPDQIVLLSCKLAEERLCRFLLKQRNGVRLTAQPLVSRSPADDARGYPDYLIASD